MILSQAALFSAISTAFVIESYKSLKQDPADASSQTLLTMSQTLMFIANGSQPTSFPPTSEMEAPPFKASAKAICVNVLWFLSLSVSVAVSLISMLAKEWCLEFIAGRTGPLGAQARRRQQRWDGILRWRMKEVIVTLPSLIHISLLLFAIGLCVFLWDVHFGVAIPVVFVTTFAAGAYFACTILPFLYNYCPYGTVLSRLLKQFTTFGSKPTRDVVANDEVTARALNWMIVNCETPRSVDIALQSLAAAGENLPPTVLDEYGAWSLVKLRHESVDMSEQSGHNRASNLYKRALEAYPLARRKVDKFWYGASDRTQRLEQLVLGIQATINSVIHELLSHADAVDDGTSNLLKRCTLIGRHFLDEGLRVDDLPGKRADWQPDGYEPYTYPLPVDPQRLAEDLVQILERYLRGQTDLDSVLYCALSASLAFVLCCNAARGLTDQSVNVGYVMRLIRGCYTDLSSRMYTASGSLEQTIMDNLVLGTLWLLISSDYLAYSDTTPRTRHGPTERALETLWSGLMSTVYSDISAMKRVETTYLAHGLLHVRTNPEKYGLTSGDHRNIHSVLYAFSSNNGYNVDGSYHAHYIQDISDNITGIKDVASSTPLFWTAVEILVDHSPWDDRYFLPTPEIYVFAVNSICLTGGIDEYSHESSILAKSPFPKPSTRLIQLLSSSTIVTQLSSFIQYNDFRMQVFGIAQLWLLFNMSLHVSDRLSTELNTLEEALLEYPGLENNLDNQEKVTAALENKLYELLGLPTDSDQLGAYNYLQKYAYRVLELMLQQRCAPLPDTACTILEEVSERLRGTKSMVNLETERSTVYPGLEFDSEGRVVTH